MKGCPYCSDIKELFKNESIDFYERDIDEHKNEYDMFVKITKNEFVPALMLIEETDGTHKSFLYAPERDYNELTEAVDIVKGHQKGILKN